MHVLKTSKQGLAFVPRHAIAPDHDVVAVQCADRNEVKILCLKRGRKLPEVAADGIEYALIVVHQVHLVYCNDYVVNTEQRGDKRVPLGLRQYAVTRIDKNDGKIRGRRAGGHVARVLLVTRRIG